MGVSPLKAGEGIGVAPAGALHLRLHSRLPSNGGLVVKSFVQFAGAATLLACLSACAVPETQPQSQSQQVAAANGPQADVVCFFEAPTGTNRKVRRCMSREEYNKGMESAHRMGDEIKIPPPPPQ